MKIKPRAVFAAALLHFSICSHAALPNSADSSPEALKQYAFELINKDRARHGSPPLKLDQGLSKVAQSYAEYMAKTGFFGHIDPTGKNPQDRANIYGIYAPVSENLAWASSSHDSPSKLLKQSQADMMAEPPNQKNHRYNIVTPENRSVGVGVARIGDKVVLVQEFSISDSPGAVAETSNQPQFRGNQNPQQRGSYGQAASSESLRIDRRSMNSGN